MNQNNITIEALQARVKKMVDDRDWSQFHNPKNLSMGISIEAAELMEKFLWCDLNQAQQELVNNKQEIEDEFADVLIALLAYANATNINVAEAFFHKIASVEAKYPIEKSKGKSVKYNKL